MLTLLKGYISHSQQAILQDRAHSGEFRTVKDNVLYIIMLQLKLVNYLPSSAKCDYMKDLLASVTSFYSVEYNIFPEMKAWIEHKFGEVLEESGEISKAVTMLSTALQDLTPAMSLALYPMNSLAKHFARTLQIALNVMPAKKVEILQTLVRIDQANVVNWGEQLLAQLEILDQVSASTVGSLLWQYNMKLDYKASVKLGERFPFTDDPVCYQLGIAHLFTGKLEKALSYFEDAHDYLQNCNFFKGLLHLTLYP